MIKDFFKRIYDLAIKLISVKGSFAILMTVLALSGKLPGYYCFIAWALFVLGREALKYFGKSNAEEK